MRRLIAAIVVTLVAAGLLPLVGRASTPVALSPFRVSIPLVQKAPPATPTPTATSEPTPTVTSEPTATATDVPPTPTDVPPTPVPAGVPVLSSFDYQSSTSYRRLVGEVQNNTGQNIEYAEVIATFYDGDGRVSGTDSGYTSIDILTPGQKSPFTVLYEASQPHASYLLQVQWRATASQPIRGITILSSGERDSSLSYRRIFGEVRNDSGGPLRYVEIIATIYDADGRVVGDESGYTALENLADGQTSPFEFLVEKRGGVRYELQTQGQRP